jgi:hypothetical protein
MHRSNFMNRCPSGQEQEDKAILESIPQVEEESVILFMRFTNE